MNTVALQFANGNVFFIGLIIGVVACLLLMRLKDRRSPVITAFAITGGILVVLSANPIPIVAYAIWLTALIATIAGANMKREKALKLRYGLIAALTGSAIMLCLFDLPYRGTPSIPVSVGQTIYVIGDSISAGCGGDIKNWPEVLADKHGVPVVNLARPGATVQRALKQVAGIQEENAVVILQIGGNDLLGRTSAGAFAEGLEKLLAMVNKDGRRLVMFELPLLPFSNRFGEAQRRLAKQYDVILLPKRYMTSVFGAPGATLDGLHLSQAGHELMAENIWDLITRGGDELGSIDT